LEFERALKQRNGVLKASQFNERALRTLSSWDEQVVRTGAAVVAHRLRVLEGLRPLFEKGYAEVAGSDELPGVVYRASWCTEVPDEDEIAGVLLSWLEGSRSKDLERGITTAGPHRDDLEITLSGSEARTFGSQGEQRSLALALRLAERDLASEARGEDPVLLLDDVFSELDDERRERLAELVMSGGQTIATATNPEGLPISPDQTMKVHAGRVVEGA
jgi:DNA replication and repair protein RecF